MSKIKFFILSLAFVATAATASAQKSGYISIEQIVYLMPEIGKIDTMLQRYQADSINSQFASIVQEYNYKDSIVNGKDSARTPVNVRRQHRQDMEGLAYQIQNWQAISQQAMEAKQQELMDPVYRKAMNALNTVAKSNGYSYVYNKQVLLVAPPGDDLLPLVAKQLNLKLPTGNAGGAAPRPAAPAPAKKQ